MAQGSQRGLPPAARYWKTRLDHTLQYTQTATRLIYIVNGGVGAIIYFIAGKLHDQPKFIFLIAFLLIVLAVVNVIHGLLLLTQRNWYRVLDDKFATSVETTVATIHPSEWLMTGWRGSLKLHTLFGTHWLYAILQFAIAAGLIVGGVLFCVLYSYS